MGDSASYAHERYEEKKYEAFEKEAIILMKKHSSCEVLLDIISLFYLIEEKSWKRNQWRDIDFIKKKYKCSKMSV